MSTRTTRDNATAAVFAFVTSALVCGAILVASMSVAPAQTLYPTPYNGGSGVCNGCSDSGFWGGNGLIGPSHANTDNSAVKQGIPSTTTTTTTLGTSTTLRVKK